MLDQRQISFRTSLLVAVALLPLVGCGGGGGGGSPTSSPSPSTPTGSSSSSSSNSSTVIGDTTEDLTTTQLGVINAFDAFKRGTFGAGTSVAIFDSGITASLSAFSGRIATGYNLTTGIGGDTVDNDGHGTQVASVLAAARDGVGMEGVAPQATIVPVKLSDTTSSGDFSFTDSQLASAILWANNQGVKLFSNSWAAGMTLQQLGSSFVPSNSRSIASYQTFVNNGGVVVFAAGNSSTAEPDVFAALPQLFSGLQKGWLAMVALDANGALDYYSNRCGSAAAWCLAAPGTAVATSVTGSVITVAGTSFAAPEGAGAVLLLVAEFPGLSYQNALKLLIQTANRTGIYADSTIYGEGLIDLNAASEPQGTTTVTTTSAVTASVTSTTITLGSAFGTGLAESLRNTDLLVRDSYNRGFFTTMSQLVTAPSASFDSLGRVANLGQGGNRYRFGPLSMEIATSVDLTSPNGGRTDLVDLRYSGQRFGFSASWGAPVTRSYALSDRADRDLLMPASVGDPYLALVQRAGAFSLSLPMAGGQATIGAAFGHAPTDIFDRNDPTRDDPGAHFPDVAVTASWRTDVANGATLAFEGGTLVESEGLLGSYGRGAANLMRATTFHAGSMGLVTLAPETMLSLGVHAGVSDASGSDASLVKGLHNVVTTSAGAALGFRNVFDADDRVMLGVGLPLRALSGRASFTIPDAITSDGSTIWRSLTAPVKANGREVDLQASWITSLDAMSDMALGVLIRRDPNNVRDTAPEGLIGARLSHSF